MCVIYFAFEQHPRYPLILAANRDEFYDRPTALAGYWEDEPQIFAGRDLVGGGTWLGITKSRRFAAVTNFGDQSSQNGNLSRGGLVADFLRSNTSPSKYLAEVRAKAAEYSGFNLLVGRFGLQIREIFYFSSRETLIRKLKPGVYGLSNNLLDVPWPKVVSGKARFAEIISSDAIIDQPLFDLLADESTAPDSELPNTGISFKREKALSAIFIKTPDYGTRCSTVLKFNRSLDFDFEERVLV